MNEALWKLPFPSSERDSLKFQKLPGRSCALICSAIEQGIFQIIFEGVESFKCTYHHACTVEMIQTYDTLSDMGYTDWLRSIKEQLLSVGDGGHGLRHLMMYFDDGPCYEFICRSFTIESETAIQQALAADSVESGIY
jgi:hypothetical protein